MIDAGNVLVKSQIDSILSCVTGQLVDEVARRIVQRIFRGYDDDRLSVFHVWKLSMQLAIEDVG